MAIGVFFVFKNFSKNKTDINSGLNNKINSISSEDTSEKRIELLKQIDDFAKESVSGKGFSSEIYSLIKVRLDQALKEIPETQVPKGKVKIWYIYNMGVIAKSSEKTIAFDLAGTYVYPNMPDFTKYIDVLFITHFHNDHFDKDVVGQALKNGVTVVIPDEKVRLEGDQLIKDPKGENILDYLSGHGKVNFNNLFIAVKPQEKTIIKGIEVTAYPANHIGSGEEFGNAAYPLDWYDVNLAGVSLLHAGDGTSFNYQPDFTNKNIDVFMIHSTTLDPLSKDTLAKLVPNAKTILPLHVLELGHGSNIVNEKHDWYMNYQSILDDYANGYYKRSEGKTRFIPLIWGESILF
jgi:L-ascorbate metabolism protein UlaG (beta-lactamase superfamily)